MTVVIGTVVTVAVATEVIMKSFSKNNLTPRQLMRCSQHSFLQFLQCFSVNQKIKGNILIWKILYLNPNEVVMLWEQTG